MIKFCKTALTVVTTIVCIAVISGSTLFLKARYDQAIEAAVQARLAQRGQSGGLTLPDFGFVDETPGRQKVASSDRHAAVAKSLIDEELREASPEEREIWFEELKQRPPEEIRELLSLRRHFSPQQGLSFDADVQFMSSESEPPRTLPETSVAEASPIAADVPALMASAVEAMQNAEQVLLNQPANDSTMATLAELRLLKEQVKALQVQDAKPTDPPRDN